MLTRRLRVCVLGIFCRGPREFLRNFAVFFLVVFFSSSSSSSSLPSTYFKNFIFYSWGQVGKKETLWKSEQAAQLRKTKSFQGRGMKAKGMQTHNHLWSLSLTQAFFFLPFFLLSSSLQATRQSGCLLRSLFILNRAWRQSTHFHIYFWDHHLEWLIWKNKKIIMILKRMTFFSLENIERDLRTKMSLVWKCE